MRSVTLTILLFIVTFTFGQNANKSARPNIVFIMADDHTSQAWGLYGGVLQDYVINKNIKRLANEGALLENAFCTNSICVPSRATILTGQYSHQNQVYTLSDKLDPNRNNVAKILSNSGYQTAIIGKWHLKSKPSGFDYFKVLPGQGKYQDPILKTAENWEDGKKGGSVYQGFSTDVITDASLEWLNKRDKTQPFMLMTHFKATHEPFDYPERYKDLFNGISIPEPSSLLEFGPQESGRAFKGQVLETLAGRWEKASVNNTKAWNYPGLPFDVNGLGAVELRKKTYQKLVKDFLKCAAAIDDNIGRVLDYLDENGLAENTVVIYTSDQGYFLGEHGFFDKRMFLEESLRMPFVIRYPKEIPANKKVDDIVLNVDFSSLILDYAGLPMPSDFQGKSFRKNLIKKSTKDWRKSMYYRYYAHSLDRPAHFGIRNERYKLIFYYGHSLGYNGAYTNETTPPKWEFYDLKKDPKELKNEYGNFKNRSVISALKSELTLLRFQTGDSQKDPAELLEIIKNNWN